MGTKNNTYLQSLGTLQLAAVISVVLGHFWFDDSYFMNSVGVSFCFVYSGFFTAKLHRFGSSYGISDHVTFMRNKLAKLYPLHVLAVLLGMVVLFVVWKNKPSPSVLLAHLTMLSSWIPKADYYFGLNPVAWFVCDLIFLYLMAPVVIKLFRKMSIVWQIALVVILLILEFIAGLHLDQKVMGFVINTYHLYQFPPIRLIDYATGIIIYNATQLPAWQTLKKRITPNLATVLEVLSIIIFLVLYRLGKTYVHPHCYRGFCASAPAIVALLTTFVLTSENKGIVSKLLEVKPFAFLSNISSEVFLLQFGVYFLTRYACDLAGINPHGAFYFLVQMSALLVTAWVVHNYYVNPMNRRLRTKTRAESSKMIK